MAKAKKKAVKQTKTKEKEEQIKIPPIDFKIAKITLVGETPLLVNRFDEKSKKQIEDKYRNKAKVKSVPQTEKEEFENALYKMPGKRNVYGIPASGVKNCAVSACRFIEGVTMTVAKGAFHVMEDKAGLITIKGAKPVPDKRTVRVGNFGNKKPAQRVRPRFDKWALTVTVKYNAGVISAEQLLNLYENAGFSIGLCEYRPEKSGNLGMFRVKRA